MVLHADAPTRPSAGLAATRSADVDNEPAAGAQQRSAAVPAGSTVEAAAEEEEAEELLEEELLDFVDEGEADAGAGESGAVESLDEGFRVASVLQPSVTAGGLAGVAAEPSKRYGPASASTSAAGSARYSDDFAEAELTAEVAVAAGGDRADEPLGGVSLLARAAAARTPGEPSAGALGGEGSGSVFSVADEASVAAGSEASLPGLAPAAAEAAGRAGEGEEDYTADFGAGLSELGPTGSLRADSQSSRQLPAAAAPEVDPEPSSRSLVAPAAGGEAPAAGKEEEEEEEVVEEEGMDEGEGEEGELPLASGATADAAEEPAPGALGGLPGLRRQLGSRAPPACPQP